MSFDSLFPCSPPWRCSMPSAMLSSARSGVKLEVRKSARAHATHMIVCLSLDQSCATRSFRSFVDGCTTTYGTCLASLRYILVEVTSTTIAESDIGCPGRMPTMAHAIHFSVCLSELNGLLSYSCNQFMAHCVRPSHRSSCAPSCSSSLPSCFHIVCHRLL